MQYYTHDQNGLYSGSGEAEPGDVPGSFYYPTNSVTEAPPTLEPGAWRWNGTAWAEVTPEEIATALLAAITSAIQTRLDDFAQTRNYDGILSAASYATSTNPKFAAEGQYAVEARDATWAKAYEILAEVEVGERPMPTLEEVLAELPVPAWPSES
jgi:hypothetical protein